jgi:arsenate reductase (glutaredoxin)
VKKFYYLSSCSTCKRIMDELSLQKDVVLQDIKTQPISNNELEELKQLSGSYEALFSKRAQLYKERDLKSKSLTETDYKSLILEHYTFLKRPVLVHENKVFIGNASKTVQEALNALNG